MKNLVIKGVEYPLAALAYRITIKGKDQTPPVTVLVKSGTPKPWNEAKGKGYRLIWERDGIEPNFLDLRAEQRPESHLYEFDNGFAGGANVWPEGYIRRILNEREQKELAEIEALSRDVTDPSDERVVIVSEEDTPEPKVPPIVKEHYLSGAELLKIGKTPKRGTRVDYAFVDDKPGSGPSAEQVEKAVKDLGKAFGKLGRRPVIKQKDPIYIIREEQNTIDRANRLATDLFFWVVIIILVGSAFLIALGKLLNWWA